MDINWFLQIFCHTCSQRSHISNMSSSCCSHYEQMCEDSQSSTKADLYTNTHRKAYIYNKFTSCCVVCCQHGENTQLIGRNYAATNLTVKNDKRINSKQTETITSWCYCCCYFVQLAYVPKITGQTEPQRSPKEPFITVDEFYRSDALPITQPTVSKNFEGIVNNVKEPNMFHNYETEKTTRKASDAAENPQFNNELFGSSARDRHV